MKELNIIEGDFNIAAGQTPARFAIAAARFNGFIVNSLIEGAADALRRHGVAGERIDLIWVPGAFELPLAVKQLAAAERYAGVIALGAVIRGSTPHFDYVAGECTKGLGAVSMNYDLPIGFGVLTVDSIEQAVERAGTKAGNKGFEAALTVIEMVSLLQNIASDAQASA